MVIGYMQGALVTYPSHKRRGGGYDYIPINIYIDNVFNVSYVFSLLGYKNNQDE